VPSPAADGPAAFVRAHRADLLARLGKLDLEPEVRRGDARDLSFLADGSVHLVVTSPPYPLVAMWDALFEGATSVAADDAGAFDAWHAWLGSAWTEVARVLAPGGIACVNVGDATRSVNGRFRCFVNHVEVARRLEAAGLEPLVPILWKKPTNKPNAFLGSGFLPTNGYVTLDCEHVLIHRKAGARRFPPHDPLRYASSFSKEDRDRWFTQVWTLNGARQGFEGDAADRARRDRTGGFPRELPERLVRMFSVVGDVVLDPFCGTGEAVAAARDWGRKGVGVELDKAVAEAARRRVGTKGPSPEALLRRLARG